MEMCGSKVFAVTALLENFYNGLIQARRPNGVEELKLDEVASPMTIGLMFMLGELKCFIARDTFHMCNAPYGAAVC